ncbi:beta-lactamase/transpeptidase-like protein [Chaetomium strumarium]|uniref:Beta-lactamase/transpeptidase-like protein n=1 Tax=Chaetomium strumarium TaxID=1170767 RepID=A0AAJ0GTJ8_9PEZI|nr:beta-lactamase/transpeptidase-like protein [Chaetomium strumarium]
MMAEKLDSILNSYVAHDTTTKDKLLGAAFIVVNKDGPIYQGAAGRTRVSPSSPAFSTNSITWVASATKLLTTTCLMHLVERGKITLDEDVRPLVPELGQLPILKGFSAAADDDDSNNDGEPILVPNTKPITLRHLLTHTSGLGVDVADPDLIRWSRHVGRTANVGSCTIEGWSSPLKFAPGEGWYYGIGPEWAGQVLERVTGQRLGEYMAEHLCGPLGMEDTGFRLNTVVLSSGEKEARFVPISERSGATGELAEGKRNLFPAEPVCESGGAGLYTSAADYAKVMQALLKALAGEEEEEEKGGVVRGETVRQMLTPQLNEAQREWAKGIVFTFGSAAELPAGTPVDHGIGGLLAMGDVQGKRRKGSLMWSGMCNSRWWIDPQTGIGGVLIVNVIPYGDATALKLYDELERAVYGELLPK